MRNRTPANSQSYFSILLVYGLIIEVEAPMSTSIIKSWFPMPTTVWIDFVLEPGKLYKA